MRKNKSIIEGILLDKNVTFTLIELCDSCIVSQEILNLMIEHSIISPVEEKSTLFDVSALDRVKKALRLQRDLAINWEGISVILDLQDEVKELEQLISLLQSQTSSHFR